MRWGGLVEFQSPDEIRRSYPDGVRELADGGTWNTIAGVSRRMIPKWLCSLPGCWWKQARMIQRQHARNTNIG